MNKIRRVVLLMQAGLGFALAPAPAQTPPPAESTPAQPTPTPTLGDRFTQVLKDQHVVFRFFAPKANAGLLKAFLNKYSGADFYTTVYRREPVTHPPPPPP